MKTVSFIKDFQARRVRYLKDIWQSSPVLFSGGNAFYAAATGVVGGFAVSSLPAAAIQLGITGLIAFEQAKATYNGKGYDTPFRRLAYANWATAAALVCGAATTATPIAFVAAAIPAVVLTAWGAGHWDLNRALKQTEKAKDQESPEAKAPDDDRMVKRLIRRSQLLFGFADCGAVVTGSVQGNNLQQVVSSTIHGLANWEALLPFMIFGVGVAQASSNRASNVVTKIVPRVLARNAKRLLEKATPNRWYGVGYAMAGIGALAASILGEASSASSLIAKTTCLVSAYGIWSRAYFALDETKVAPESAARFQQRRLSKLGNE